MEGAPERDPLLIDDPLKGQIWRWREWGSDGRKIDDHPHPLTQTLPAMCQEELLQVGRATVFIQKPQVGNVALPKARSHFVDHLISMRLRDLRPHHSIKGVIPYPGNDPLNLISYMPFGKLRGPQVGQHLDYIDVSKQWPPFVAHGLQLFTHGFSFLCLKQDISFSHPHGLDHHLWCERRGKREEKP